MKVNATQEQRDFCKDFLRQGSIAQRGKFDGDEYQQLFGLMGQVIVMDFLKLPRPRNEGFDGGIDLTIGEKTFDVKCVSRTVEPLRHFVNNLTAFQINYKVDGYIFLSYNKTTGLYTICGWASKKDFLEKSILYKKGESRIRDNGTEMINQTDNYEIRNDELRKFGNYNRMLENFKKKGVFI